MLHILLWGQGRVCLFVNEWKHYVVDFTKCKDLHLSYVDVINTYQAEGFMRSDGLKFECFGQSQCLINESLRDSFNPWTPDWDEKQHLCHIKSMLQVSINKTPSAYIFKCNWKYFKIYWTMLVYENLSLIFMVLTNLTIEMVLQYLWIKYSCIVYINVIAVYY